MNFATLALPVVILINLTAILMLINQDWRWNIATLAIQYVGVFILVAAYWPLEMAVAKMVAGWMAGAVLGIAYASAIGSRLEVANARGENLPGEEQLTISGRLFRFFIAAIIEITVFSLVPLLSAWVPGIDSITSFGGMILLSLGLVQLGLSVKPLRVSIGLLTMLAGFEILYAALETSALLAGLLATVNIGMALIGAYLMLAPTMEVSE
jgi:hypothetical protein